MKLKTVNYIAVSISFLCVLSENAFSKSSKPHLKVVGTNFSKIYEKNSKGQYSGVAVDILKKLEKEMDVEFQLEILPWKRALEEMQKNRFDILVGAYKTKERMAYLDYVEPAFYSDIMIFYKHQEDKVIWNKDFSSLKGQEIVSIAGWSYGEDFDRQKKLMNLFEVDHLSSGFKMLEHKRVKLFAANLRNAEAHLKESSEKYPVKQLEVPIGRMNGHFAFSTRKDLGIWRKRFEELLLKMKAGNEIGKLNQKYGLEYLLNQ